MARLSNRKTVAILGVAASATMIAGIGYAFVVNTNANNSAAVQLASENELPQVVEINDLTQPHLQPGASETIYVWVTNPGNETLEINSIPGGQSLQVGTPPSNGTAGDGSYCPAGSIQVADATPAQGATALTTVDDAYNPSPTPPTDPNSGSPFTAALTGATSLAPGEAGIYAMTATFDVKDYQPTLTGNTGSSYVQGLDPNDQTGCLGQTIDSTNLPIGTPVSSVVTTP